jgi:hypothetical protein
MSYASSESKMTFYEDFYAVTVVSIIYYEEEQNRREALLNGKATENDIEP